MTVLCVGCRDDVRATLARLFPKAEYLEWSDPLCEGPAPANIDGTAWYGLRASFIARRYDEILAVALHRLLDQDAALASANRYDEVVLWFGHDLFDQSILLRLLAWFADRPHPCLTLVAYRSPLSCQTDEALFRLWQERQPVSAEKLAIGQRGWQAWRKDSPCALMALAQEDHACLPFLASALWRHFQEFPHITDGLSLSERLTLLAVAEGAQNREQIFAAVQMAERAPWLKEPMFYPILRDLTDAKVPLLREWRGLWQLTPAGWEVLRGNSDIAWLNVVHRWRGGVYIQFHADWRWHSRNMTLVKLD